MFTKNLGTGSNPESETIKGRAAPIPFYGALPQAVKIDDLNRRAGGDELTSLMADADVITGDDYNENDGAPVWRDVPFAVLFLIHFCLMLWLGIFVAPAGYKNINFDLTAVEDEIRNQSDNDISEQDIQMMEVFAEELSDYLQVYPVRIVCYLVVPCLLISFFFAHFMLSAIIKPHTKPFVYSSLVGSIVGTAVVMISMAVMSHSILVYIVTGLSLLGVFNYVQLAWKMVLFAAVNLKVSLTGISTNWGMYLISFVFAGLGFLWNIYWVYVLVGVSLEKKTDCLENNSDAGVENATCSPPMFVIFGLLLSLYWTSTIIMVSVHKIRATWRW